MNSPCFVLPYHRVPGQWYTPELVLTQTFTSGFPACSVPVGDVFPLVKGEESGAVFSPDWQFEPEPDSTSIFNTGCSSMPFAAAPA